MPGLTAAHIGYEYQDLLVAVRLVDVLLGTVSDVVVDEKLVEDDRFDDLTCTDSEQHRVRFQFKHTENDDRPLTLATFTNDGRGLRLDKLISCMLADRSGPGRSAPSTTFRLVLRDRAPNDARLLDVLVPATPDPGPFVQHLETSRLQFDSDALWAAIDDEDGVFSSVRAELPDLTRTDLGWFCQQLTIELDSPPASLDLTRPGIAEEVLLRRVRADVGAESFPNTARHATDVAAAFVSAARAARQGRAHITPEELLRRSQLRSDFGAVTRSNPVDRRTQIPRPATVDVLLDAATTAATEGGCLVVTGPPGQGKSWTCHQLLERMDHEGWLIAEHYCFLGDADGEKLERVLTEHLLGSLLGHLAQADPALVDGQRPRYSADEDSLVNCVRRAIELQAGRPVALVVDGLDHITRVRAPGRQGFDPSLSVAETLASLDLPVGAVLIVLTQPGSHLAPLEALSPTEHTIAGLAPDELRQLAQRHSLIGSDGPTQQDATTPLLEDEATIDDFLEALLDRSMGNALYATYLCREALRSGADIADLASALRRFPHFDGSLENYYTHLQQSLAGDAGWVSEVIAVAGFPISRPELREIMPGLGHRVDPALEVLAPVLVERAAQGGIRIYHESFARFLRQGLLDAPSSLAEQVARLSDWLDSKGLFADTRAFRYLLPLLAEAELHDRVIDLVGLDFVTESIAAMFPASAIKANLAVAIRSAATRSLWPIVVRYVELSRAAESYEYERYESILVDFADVHIALLGATVVADRMLHDGRTAIPGRAGIQMCAAIDAAGGVAPWAEYLHAFQREAENDNTQYGEYSDRAVSVGWVRGTLRLAQVEVPVDTDELLTSSDIQPSDAVVTRDSDLLDGPIAWDQLSEWLDDEPRVLRDVIAAIVDTQGAAGVDAACAHVNDRSAFCLGVAELISSSATSASLGSLDDWVTAAIDQDGGHRFARRLLALGVDVEHLGVGPIADERRRLLELTQEIQEPQVRWENGPLEAWLNCCAIAARRDSAALDLVDSLILGDGWYRCWLRFTVALSRAEASTEDRSHLSLEAIGRLTEDLRPFAGDPRSCDLYSIHETIAATIDCAVEMLHGPDWVEGIRTLKRVSDRISTTLRGERGGPVPVDMILDLATKSAGSPEQRECAGLLIRTEVEENSGGRYYSDLASDRLYAARLELSAADPASAAESWREACSFLGGYGWHKDTTIYELLDPLTVLIAADPKRGRRCVADVQGLCERVPLHTDGKETRGAPGRWWSLLAAADPVALAQLAAPELLAECNHPNWLLNDAIEELWRATALTGDPVVVAALRLSLDSPLEPADAPALRRLLATVEANDPVLRRLMVMLIARLDERPQSYGSSNSDELLAKDADLVASLNAIALAAAVPQAITWRDANPSGARSTPSPLSPSSRTRGDAGSAPSAFRIGAPGLGQAIRRWHNRPYNSIAAEWSTARFAAAIGYRLVELAESGRSEEAESALHTLADFIGYGDRSRLLKEIAEGLERHRLDRLAAAAYALSWTRARGHGGWHSFGGDTELVSLQRARDLDQEAALSVVASEVERFVVNDRYGTIGITQALIHALATGALAVTDSLTVAFRAWDEARVSIERRAPIVHSSDMPETPYRPPNNDCGSAIVGDIDEALAIATVTSLAHPSRERKRRALVAIDALLRLRSDEGATALAVALAKPCDPATHGWLLSLASQRCAAGDHIWEAIRDPLLQLATSDYLAVRAAARRLLGSAAPELPIATPAHPMLTHAYLPGIWVPDDPDEADSEHDRVAAIVHDVAGRRLASAVDDLPGLEDVVVSTVEAAMHSDEFRELMDEQVQSFADRSRKRWPDAYLINEQTVETVLQTVAASGRAARMVAGHPASDPAAWEETLGTLLIDEPTIPLALEMTRQCRPHIPHIEPPRSKWWRNVRAGAGAVSVDLHHGQVFASISLEEGSPHRLAGGPFDDWYLIGAHETRRFDHPNSRSDEVLRAERYQIVEVRQGGDSTALHLPPVTASDLAMWGSEGHSAAPELASTQPLIGVDRRLLAAGDGRRGLGVPDAILTPTASLIAMLGLRPLADLRLQDDAGPALGLITWRTDYDVSDYYLPAPRVTGCGIAVRPDLFQSLADQLGSLLVVRDFVVADSEFGASSDAEGETARVRA